MTVEVRGPQGDLSRQDRLTRALEAVAVALAQRFGAGASVSGGAAAASSRTVPVTNAPTTLVRANPSRRQLTLQNQGASAVTLGHDQGVTFGQGIQIAAGGTATDDGSSVFLGEWWAVASVAGPVNIGVDDQG